MSENESKRMKNDTSSSKSMLSENVIAIRKKEIREGFSDGNLCLNFKYIDDSMMPELGEWIIKLGDKVKRLDLAGNQITSVGASMLLDMLKTNNSSIKEITLGDNKQIDDKCMKSLGEYIKSNKNIETIKLSYTSISDGGIEILAPYLDGNTTFRQLHLSRNKGITDKSAPVLARMIESSCIEDIDIHFTLITQMNTIYTLVACNRIKYGSTSLDTSLNGINDDDLIKICYSMKEYGIDKFKEINLVENHIKSRGASVLFDTLKECKSVVSKLNLSHNQLDDECMKQLGEYLQDNNHVELLRLGYNKITDKGAEMLSEYLIGDTTLKVLNLNDNGGITDASVPHLIEMVNKSCIGRMDLHRTSISDEKKQEIYESLSIPIGEREIPIRSNTKSVAKIQSSSASTST